MRDFEGAQEELEGRPGGPGRGKELGGTPLAILTGLKISRSDPGLYQTCSRSDIGKTIRKPRPFKSDRALHQAIRPAFASPGRMRLLQV